MTQEVTHLRNGIAMPTIGIGTWQLNDQQAEATVTAALEAGYRSIDTAAAYGNERGVGRAIARSGLGREELFVTTKLHDMQGGDHATRQYQASLDRLGLDYADLYLIHWPIDDYTHETWSELEELYAAKRVRAIGVSNFSSERLQKLMEKAAVVPFVNQVELHPYLSQQPLREFCAQHDIQVESWSPLMQGSELLAHPTIATIANNHAKTPAQIILRWHIQHGLAAIPKATSPQHLQQNLHIFDFTLSQQDMAEIDNLNQNRRANPVANPDTFAFTREIYDQLQHIND